MTPPAAPPPALETRAVQRTFSVGDGLFRRRRTLNAVNGVSLTVPRGAIVGLVGESGCGKTTLARMLLGLLAPTGGEILLDGQPVHTLPRKEIARRVQPIFQDPYSSLNPRKTVQSIISLPLRVHGVGNRAEQERRVLDLMDRVGLARRMARSYPNQLSGGQRQRVAIARALVMRPQVVICDEPTSALDVSVQSQILNLLQDLQQELNLTYLLISHNLAVVRHMATHVAVMYLGRIVEEAPTDLLFRQPRHPYTRALLESALTPEPGKGVPDTRLGGSFPNPLDPPSGCALHPRCPDVMDICRMDAPRPSAEGGHRVECHLYGQDSGRPAGA
jgi:peptide/nickel transport system ATP-binding protein